MRIVAIETSGRFGSVAALTGEGSDVSLVSQSTLGGDQRTAQALAPALHELLEQIGWTPSSIQLVAVTVGPGSFTGLRIGVTTAKTICYAVGAEVIGVNTLAAMAAQAPKESLPLWTILDAQREELFVAKFHDGSLGATAIVARDSWLAQLQPGDRVCGPPLRSLGALLPPGVIMVPIDCWQPMAAAVGHVGWQGYRSGRRDDVWQLLPQYYRASAAEEKLL
jgi:tRNA threonylcarbamoyladenosine biosynthesis protein TsaB